MDRKKLNTASVLRHDRVTSASPPLSLSLHTRCILHIFTHSVINLQVVKLRVVGNCKIDS